MVDLFDAGRLARDQQEQPLAARLRPRSLDEFAGQEHILGPGRLLRRAIQADQLSSVIFYGPPGTGKTTLASVIAHTTRSHFISINAVLAGVADIRAAIEEARERRRLHSQRTTLFVDEVHRFNRAQQDALLPWVENGTVVLIGATTENPYFSVNRPLLSRSRVFQLRSLTPGALSAIATHALEDTRGYAGRRIQLADDARSHLVNVANGDARALLNALELAVETTAPDPTGVIHISLEVAEESIQHRALLYDKEGDYHFDTISAFIKSLRGSDPDAALYWMARMVYAGEDPHFIFRRMLIFASEDVGLADPQALSVVVAAAEAFDRVGLPEGRFPLAQAALYLATAAKSNSTFAFFDALTTVEKEQDQEVPTHLRDASRDSEGFGHGAGYLYPHAYRDHWVAQQYLPDGLQGRVFYEPSEQGYERRIREQVRRRREVQLAAMVESPREEVEGLTFSPPDRARDQWLQRVASDLSVQLAALRDRVMAAARLQRHHLVLDLEAGTGVLTWEALRRTPEGGAWTLTADRATAVALHETAAQLPELARPVILTGTLDQLDELVEAHTPGLRFDVVIGRNAWGRLVDKLAAARMVLRVLRPGGRLVLSEVVARRSQRLRHLVDLSSLTADLATRLTEAEEAIYAGPGPQLTWDSPDLEAALGAAGFVAVRLQLDTHPTQRRLTLGQLAEWFAPGGEKRATYASHLRRRLDEAEVRQVRRLFEQQLVNQTVAWTSTHLLVYAEKDAADAVDAAGVPA